MLQKPSYHDIDQLSLHHKDLPGGLPSKETCDPLIRKRPFPDLLLRRPRRDRYLAPYLPIDLDDNKPLLLLGYLCTIDGPGDSGYRKLISHHLPHLFSDMRCKGGQEEDQAVEGPFHDIQEFLIFCTVLLGNEIDIVHKLHNKTDGGIKMKDFDVLTDLLDGLMDDLPE